MDGECVGAERFEHGLAHAAGLVGMVGRVIEGAGWTPRDIDEVYLSIGPGSFTGLRIGVTLVKSWWLARQLEGEGELKVVAVPTVRVVVENLGAEARHGVVVMDAKRGQVFTASFSRDDAGEWQERRAARVDVLKHVVAAEPRPVVLVGEGLVHHLTEAEAGVERAGPELGAARAEALGRIGFSLGRRGEFANPLTLVPTYIRLPEAEEKWRLERGMPLGETGVMR